MLQFPCIASGIIAGIVIAQHQSGEQETMRRVERHAQGSIAYREAGIEHPEGRGCPAPFPGPGELEYVRSALLGYAASTLGGTGSWVGFTFGSVSSRSSSLLRTCATQLAMCRLIVTRAFDLATLHADAALLI